MPIDPRKLAAFANPTLTGGAPAPAPRRPAPPAAPPPAAGAPAPLPVGEEDPFAPLRALVAQYADDVEASCDELDGQVLRDLDAGELSPEDVQILKDAVAGFDEEFVEGLKEALADGLSAEQASAVGDQLEAEGVVEDGERVAGWLFRVAEVLGAPAGDAAGEVDEGDADEDVAVI